MRCKWIIRVYLSNERDWFMTVCVSVRDICTNDVFKWLLNSLNYKTRKIAKLDLHYLLQI